MKIKKTLLTLREIAEELDVAESTCRYWKNRYNKWVPSRGRGRRQRYYPEAIAVLRLVRDLSDSKLTQYDIKLALNTEFTKEIQHEPQQELKTTTNADLLPATIDKVFPAFEKMINRAMKASDQAARIEALEKRLAALEKPKLLKRRRPMTPKKMLKTIEQIGRDLDVLMKDIK